MHSRRFIAHRLVVIIAASLLCLVPEQLFGDGLDLGWFVRVPMMEFHSVGYIAGVIVGVMFVNYVLNFLVIGLPAVLWGGALLPTVAVGLTLLTILGQIADRLGAVLGLITGIVINNLYVVAISNLIYSGLAVFLLARYFLNRWSVPDPSRWKIALAAGIITNPCWFIFIMASLPQLNRI